MCSVGEERWDIEVMEILHHLVMLNGIEDRAVDEVESGKVT